MFTKQTTIAIAALLGGTAVLAGAFGAHGFEASANQRGAELFETASTYQMWHALALLGLAALNLEKTPAVSIFLLAILLFCGSLYLYALTELRWLVFVTPFGGLGFIIGWLLVAWTAVRQR